MTLNKSFSMSPFENVESFHSLCIETSECEKDKNQILWVKAHDQLLKIAQMEKGWDGDGAPAISEVILRSTSRLLHRLEKVKGYRPPNDIYPVPDGNIVAEWQFPDDVIMRIEVDAFCRGELMISYADLPSKFSRVSWPAVPQPFTMGSRRGAVISSTTVDGPSLGYHNLLSKLGGSGQFQLAA